MSTPKYDVPRTLLYPKIVMLERDKIDIPDQELIDTKDGKMLFESVNIIESIHPSWYPLLIERGIDFNKRLKEIYKKGYQTGLSIRPHPKEVFNVFRTPLTAIKAVVVGQDPYPGWDKENKRPIACGYSFATLSERTPPSLERIRASIIRQFGSITIKDEAHPNNLRGWIDQGVFLLNYTPILFTTFDDSLEEEMSPRMRSAFETPIRLWSGVTETICKEIIAVNSRCPFILMGQRAQCLGRVVGRSYATSHPSTRTDCDFTGECFDSIPEIDWKRM
jgi:uracil DNA glycosylase